MKYFLSITIFILQLSTSMTFANQWSTPMIILDTLVYEPQLEIDNNDNLHLVFEKDIQGSSLDIFYTHFDGYLWAPPINISNSEKLSLYPRSFMDKDNRLHVIWGEANVQPEKYYRPLICDLLYSYYETKKWLEPLNYYHTEVDSSLPPGVGNIAVSSKNLVHLMWTDIPWLKYTYVNNDTPAEVQNIRWGGSAPDIYVDNQNTIHVSYISVPRTHSYNRSDVFYFYYSEADSVWSDSVMVHHNPNHYSYYPQIITDNRRRIHIVWMEDEDLNIFPEDIYHAFSDDGVNWSEAYDISHLGGNTYTFDIAVDSKGYLHVVWDQSVEAPILSLDHVFYAMFNGESWSEPQRITPEGRRMAGVPTIAVDSQDYLHVVWLGKLYEGDDWKLLYSTTKPTTPVFSSEEVALVHDFQLYQNYPNPFNATTDIIFFIPSSTEVSLTIFDLKGRCVKKLLVENTMPRGAYKVQWNGTNETGTRAASGVYLYQLKTQNFTETKKMILLF